jgi:hypothetical protein
LAGSMPGILMHGMRHSFARRATETPFSKAVADATGKRVLAIDPKNEADQRVVKRITQVLDEVMKRINAPDRSRISPGSEASSHLEDLLRELLNRVPGFSCDFPHTSEDFSQFCRFWRKPLRSFSYRRGKSRCCNKTKGSVRWQRFILRNQSRPAGDNLGSSGRDCGSDRFDCFRGCSDFLFLHFCR